MKYTKTVREYCDKHKKEMLEIAKVKNNQFADIPYKTLLKILNRLEEEHIITSVSKGIYYIGTEQLDENDIISKYTANGKGMLVGYSLFNEIGLTEFKDDKIEIYSNAISANTHTVGRISIKRIDLKFNEKIVDLIALLEILDAVADIEDCDYIAYLNITTILSRCYTDGLFERIIKAIKYQYSTISRLNDLLHNNCVENDCLNLYNKVVK